MYYGDKRDAKVKIANALEEKGWKIYGYSEDQSDSMTDYYCPASWGGIAEKNGFVLLIDISGSYGLSYSGQEIRKYNYNVQAAISNERIIKLRAMMNDSASTENEKASCAVLIQKEEQKAGKAPEYTVIDTYPIFHHVNPKSCTWHIEREGQIIAKGKGVFSINDYDWEDDTKSAKEQKEERLNSFINKIESVLRNSGALRAEVVKVEKKVIKPVQKEDKTINVNDILSFSYHGHYWIVTDIYTVGGQERATYELLGSEKRGYNRLNGASVKRYYQPMARLQKEMEEGKVKVYTLQEVTEIEEKTVYKKTARKSAMKQDVPELTGKVEETETEQATDNNSVAASYTLNSELNGVEVSFPNKPDQTTIDGLKSHGFRWHKFKKVWYAIQSPERLAFVKAICGNNSAQEEEQEEQPENAAEETVEEAITTTNEGLSDSEQPITQTENDSYTFQADTNYKYHDIHFKAWNMELEELQTYLTVFEIPFYITGDKFICIGLTSEQVVTVEEINQVNGAIIFYDSNYYEKPYNSSTQEVPEEKQHDNVIQFPKQEQEQQKENNINSMDDIFSKFDNVKVENTSRIAADDLEFCINEEKKYKIAIDLMIDFSNKVKEVSGLDILNGEWHREKSTNSYLDGYKLRDFNKIASEVKEKFIYNIVNRFSGKYNVTIDITKMKFDFNVTYENIIDMIMIQLDGFSFTEKAEKEIKDKLKNNFENRWSKVSIKNKKMTITDYIWWDSYSWSGKRIGWNDSKLQPMFQALSLFERGSTDTLTMFENVLRELKEGEQKYDIFSKYEFEYLDKVKSFKVFKNGKTEIEFTTTEQALHFAKEFCGISNVA